jgi:hypothetical protein
MYQRGGPERRLLICAESEYAGTLSEAWSFEASERLAD